MAKTTLYFLEATTMSDTARSIEAEYRWEARVHKEFFLPYYRENSWTVKDDYVGQGKHPWDVTIERTWYSSPAPLAPSPRFTETLKVEEKAHHGQFPAMLIEIVQDMVTGSPGWFLTCEADVLLDLGQDDRGHTLRWVDMEKLRASTWIDAVVRYGYNTGGWGLTLYALVPWAYLEKEGIARRD
jgi:hypothetical protein